MTGPTLLRAWRDEKKMKIGTLARALGVDWGSLRDWEDGVARPGLDAAVAIQRVCGIAPEAWTDAVQSPAAE